MSGATAKKIRLAYEAPPVKPGWELPEEDVPESAWHGAIIDLLMQILRAWAERTNTSALVASDLALRFVPERWSIGVNPDVAMYIPPPPEGEETESVCLWREGHAPPRLAIEIVSRGSVEKDYQIAPEQYAASGTTEVWIFDPKRFGKKQPGGAALLQVWRRDEQGAFKQLYRGDGPFKSPELDAWIVVTDGGKRLRIADDPEGKALWLTPHESESVERARERERADRLAAEIAELKAKLERLTQT